MLPQIGKVDKTVFDKLILPRLGRDAVEVATIAIEIAQRYRERIQG